jgi:hypothetical protein
LKKISLKNPGNSAKTSAPSNFINIIKPAFLMQSKYKHQLINLLSLDPNEFQSDLQLSMSSSSSSSSISSSYASHIISSLASMSSLSNNDIDIASRMNFDPEFDVEDEFLDHVNVNHVSDDNQSSHISMKIKKDSENQSEFIRLFVSSRISTYSQQVNQFRSLFQRHMNEFIIYLRDASSQLNTIQSSSQFHDFNQNNSYSSNSSASSHNHSNNLNNVNMSSMNVHANSSYLSFNILLSRLEGFQSV